METVVKENPISLIFSLICLQDTLVQPKPTNPTLAEGKTESALDYRELNMPNIPLTRCSKK